MSKLCGPAHARSELLYRKTADEKDRRRCRHETFKIPDKGNGDTSYTDLGHYVCVLGLFNRLIAPERLTNSNPKLHPCALPASHSEKESYPCPRLILLP